MTEVFPQSNVRIEDNAFAFKSEVERQFLNAVTEVYEGAQELLVRKHQDYGPGNISGAPGGALNGLQVRMHDKLARIAHLLNTSPRLTTQNESLRDSFVDLANYALIGVLVLDGDWPSE